jgi:hypothetical protein
MHIGMANAASGDFDEHLRALRRWVWPVEGLKRLGEAGDGLALHAGSPVIGARHLRRALFRRQDRRLRRNGAEEQRPHLVSGGRDCVQGLTLALFRPISGMLARARFLSAGVHRAQRPAIAFG